MADILYAPNPEHVVTTNVWAFLHWLRTAYGIDLADWGALQRFSVQRSTEFRAAVAQFARLPQGPARLARHSGTREALVFRRAGGSRPGFSRDELVRASLAPSALPAELAAPLARLWPPAILVRPCAELLLHADLRPDDRLLVLGPAWPWLVALMEGCTSHSGDRRRQPACGRGGGMRDRPGRPRAGPGGGRVPAATQPPEPRQPTLDHRNRRPAVARGPAPHLHLGEVRPDATGPHRRHRLG